MADKPDTVRMVHAESKAVANPRKKDQQTWEEAGWVVDEPSNKETKK